MHVNMVTNKRNMSIVLRVVVRCLMALPAVGVVSFLPDKSANLMCS